MSDHLTTKDRIERLEGEVIGLGVVVGLLAKHAVSIDPSGSINIYRALSAAIEDSDGPLPDTVLKRDGVKHVISKLITRVDWGIPNNSS